MKKNSAFIAVVAIMVFCSVICLLPIIEASAQSPTNTPIIITNSGQAYYFRSDLYTTNTISAYGFDTDFTNNATTITNVGGS